mmetsp:Transcript_14636/g.34542  ORF Transcript_14636/g.34542 Transcript_14636/m.34542 type:complete len:210 (+) Transcript_14636:96-725(+)
MKLQQGKYRKFSAGQAITPPRPCCTLTSRLSPKLHKVGPSVSPLTSHVLGTHRTSTSFGSSGPVVHTAPSATKSSPGGTGRHTYSPSVLPVPSLPEPRLPEPRPRRSCHKSLKATGLGINLASQAFIDWQEPLPGGVFEEAFTCRTKLLPGWSRPCTPTSPSWNCRADFAPTRALNCCRPPVLLFLPTSGRQILNGRAPSPGTLVEDHT